MRIRFTRLGVDVELSAEKVTTLQIEDRTLFSRIVQSLLSEKGEEAVEPYVLLKEGDEIISPKKAFLVVNTLPELPLNDKALLSQLYQRMRQQSEMDSDRYQHIRELMDALISEIETISDTLWGSYATTSESDLESLLKLFGFQTISGEDYSLVDNTLRLIELLSDVDYDHPLVLVNAKSFFSRESLVEVYEKAFFSKIPLLLLESWSDDAAYDLETKIVVDQDFCVL